MNFTLLPSSSLLIHSCSGMFVAHTCNGLSGRCDLFSSWPRGFLVLHTNVDSKLFVALSFVLLLHFIQRLANKRTSWLKHPVTRVATQALTVLVLNPYHLAWHARSIRP